MASRSHRFPLLALALVVALLALPAVAAAQSDSSALATERYYSSYGEHAATPAAADPSDGPGWTVVLLGGVAVLLAGVAFGAVGTRATVRPRGASA